MIRLKSGEAFVREYEMVSEDGNEELQAEMVITPNNRSKALFCEYTYHGELEDKHDEYLGAFMVFANHLIDTDFKDYKYVSLQRPDVKAE